MAVRLAGFPGVNQKMTSITCAAFGKMELLTSLLSIAESQKMSSETITVKKSLVT